MRRPALRDAVLLLVFLLPVTAPLSAQTATLVKDLATRGQLFSGSPSPQNLWAVGDKVFFTAETASAGREIWVTDGSQNGTTLLRDICPGDCSPGALPLAALRDVLIFSVHTVSGIALWRTDGTRSGTYVLTPATGTNGGQAPGTALATAGAFFFYVGCDSGGCVLWATDGTQAGTRQVAASSSNIDVAAVGDRAAFTRAGSSGNEVWVTDGSAGGTALVKSLGLGSIRGPAAVAGHLFFAFTTAADGEELWASDGTPAGTLAVTHFAAAKPFDNSFGILIEPTAAGRHLYFLADDGVHGEELWRSDGTLQGTLRISDFTNPAPFATIDSPVVEEAGDRAVFLASDGTAPPTLWSSQGSPQSMVRLANPCGGACQFIDPNAGPSLTRAGSNLFFLASDGVHGEELWITDGTVTGTHMVQDFCPGTCSGASGAVLVPIGGTLFLNAFANGNPQLWRIDGTAAGTRKLTDFRAGGVELRGRQDLAVSGNRVYFPAQQNVATGLWVVEGTKAPRLVASIDREEPSSNPAEFTALRDRVLFVAGDVAQRNLWETDGTAAGTSQVTVTPFDSATGLTPAGDALLFQAITDGVYSLWRTDGTTSGTAALVTDRFTGNPTAFAGAAFFFSWTTDSPASPKELWRSDGTAAGTGPVATVSTASGVFPSALAVVDHEMYFVTSDFSSAALWQSDGTAAGTQQLAPLPGRGNDDVLRPVRAGSRVYFLNGGSLWATDGTPGGTELRIDGFQTMAVTDLAALNGVLYLLATPHGSSTLGLWRSDGTVANTSLVKELGAASSLIIAGSAGSRLFFVNDDGIHGAELWTSDGTAAGTVLVRDILPGPDSSAVDHLTAAGSRVFFSAFDGLHGTELWESDGTEAGTRMVQDIEPGAAPSGPAELSVTPGPSGDRLFFSAFDDAAGREPWVLPLSGPPGCQPSATALCLSGGRYRIEAVWRDFSGHTGTGQAVALTADTGYFWFFAPSNVETVIKILDGRGVNGHVWVFYGALSNVEYTLTVTDTETGLTRQYYNPPGLFASVGDVYGFGPRGASEANPRVASPSTPPLVSERTGKAASVPCQASAERLCLNGNRFSVTVAWKDFQGHTGKGTAASISSDTGTFWFFNAANVELVVKALDGRAVNGHFWIFFGALSNVEYSVTVTDTQTNKTRTYTNPSGQFASVADTLAF